MSNDASRLWAISFAASAYLFFEAGIAAQTVDQLPDAQEPMLAEPGDWAADFNEAQLACFQGSMRACDSIWLSERVLLDSFLGQYGRSCGGRVDSARSGARTSIAPRLFPVTIERSLYGASE